MNRSIFIYLFILSSYVLNAQEKTVNVLVNDLKNTTNDTSRIKILSELSELCEIDDIKKYCEEIITLSEKHLGNSNKTANRFYAHYVSSAYNNIGFFYSEKNDPEKAINYYLKALGIQEKIKDSLGIAATLNNIGLIYNQQNNIPQAIAYFEKSLKIRQQLNDLEGLAGSLINIGAVYNNHGNILKALENYHKALKIYESTNNKKGIALALNNIAFIYQNQNDITKAIEYYNKAFAIQQKLKDKNGIANSLNNIGLILSSKKEYANALKYFNKCLKLREETGDKKGKALAYNNIATVYADEKQIDQALIYYTSALNTSIEIDDKKGMALAYNNIGIMYNKKGDGHSSKENALKSLALSTELGLPESIKYASNLLYTLYKNENNNAKALEMYELYLRMRDSINNQETRKASIKSQLKYEYEKKAAADSVKVAEEKKITTLQLKQEENQRYFLYGGLGLTLVFGVFMFNRFRITKKQKNIIEDQKTIVENQKKLVEEKQKEVMDSIRYAKRIQTSLLPTEKYLERNLKH
ncbi:MAG: tetratricopeptide repeat protein [Bacteroidota bacterium]|nr:tetratricopeptide repeat protein [Bacteroidota bacterium]